MSLGERSGCQLPVSNTDRFGCPLGKLTINQAANGADMNIYRKASAGREVGQVRTAGAPDGFLIGVSLSRGHERRLKHEHHTTGHRFDNGSIYIRDLASDYRADLLGAFDFMLFKIPQAALAQFANDADRETFSLVEQVAAKDPFLEKLCLALAPALGNQENASPLFVDLMSRAVGSHLLHRYSREKLRDFSEGKKLSTPDMARAKGYFLENLAGNVSVNEAAATLNMSPALFIRMFRETTGMTPHRWIVQHRLEKAISLLGNSDLSLEEIGLACGFSGQTHFTRVFSAHMGVPPGKWRRSI